MVRRDADRHRIAASPEGCWVVALLFSCCCVFQPPLPEAMDRASASPQEFAEETARVAKALAALPPADGMQFMSDHTTWWPPEAKAGVGALNAVAWTEDERLVYTRADIRKGATWMKGGSFRPDPDRTIIAAIPDTDWFVLRSYYYKVREW